MNWRPGRKKSLISKEKDPSGYFGKLLSCASEGLPPVTLLGEEWLETHMPVSPEDSNKGTFGKALLLAGSRLYPGAALLAAKACLAGGCGVLTVYSDEAARAYFTQLPEAIFRTAEKDTLPETIISGSDAVGMGPGWGSTPDENAARTALLSAGKLLIDADGLNLLSRQPELKKLLSQRCVLTPHPGEMSRLTGVETSEIVRDPARFAYRFACEWGCTVLLKGTCTVVAEPGAIVITAGGNNGLAKGGSGDVLSGLITAMLCRGKEPFEAACLGSLLLGAGAQKAYTLLKTRLLRASDITDAIMKGII